MYQLLQTGRYQGQKLTPQQRYLSFKSEVVLMSFSCEFCGFSETGTKFTMPGTPIFELSTRWIKFLVTMKSREVHSQQRQVVRSEKGAFGIPEIDFESYSCPRILL